MAVLVALCLHARGTESRRVTQAKQGADQSDSFQCPAECYHCCALRGRDDSFKCILKGGTTGEDDDDVGDSSDIDELVAGNDKTKIVKGRECSKPKRRSWGRDKGMKTACRYLAEDSAEGRPNKVCKTKTEARKLATWVWSKRTDLKGFVDVGGDHTKKLLTLMHFVRKHGTEKKRFIPLKHLLLMHPIDHKSAVQKTGKRARQMHENQAKIRDEFHYKLSEEQVNNAPELSEMKSIGSFETVALGDEDDDNFEGFVTIEGNGRSNALRWAFPKGEMHDNLKIEVTEYRIGDKDKREKAWTMLRDIRSRSGTAVFEHLTPESIDDEFLAKWEPWADKRACEPAAPYIGESRILKEDCGQGKWVCKLEELCH